MTSTMTAQGQVTIPSNVRESLGLVDGARLRVEVESSGKIILIPLPASKQESKFGCMQGTIEILGDIVEPLHDEWNGPSK
jgi:AbrB family looped-hinge helix DNA binding protein